MTSNAPRTHPFILLNQQLKRLPLSVCHLQTGVSNPFVPSSVLKIDMFLRSLTICFWLIAWAFSPIVCADTQTETHRSMIDVIKIAYAISTLQPGLEEPKYVEYAMGIYRASKKYNIRPALLIAIAYQESSFRESIPEGSAGEIGITQVLKRWLNNPRFKSEFKTASKKSMKKPALSFSYSAWIIKELRREKPSGTLPYWSYYNARKFTNRISYFIQINKHLAKLKRNLYQINRATHIASLCLLNNEEFQIPLDESFTADRPRKISSTQNRTASTGTKPPWVLTRKDLFAKPASVSSPSYDLRSLADMENSESPKKKTSKPSNESPQAMLLRSAGFTPGT
jgi:hypothetical protein